MNSGWNVGIRWNQGVSWNESLNLPTVRRMVPTSGSTIGSTLVTVDGTNLDVIEQVQISNAERSWPGVIISRAYAQLTFLTPMVNAAPEAMTVTLHWGDESLTAGTFTYTAPIAPPESERSRLPGVIWDGYELNVLEAGGGTSLIVTDFNGWYGTPGADVGDVARALIDGMLWGPKALVGREMTLEGYVIGGTRRDVTSAMDRIAVRAGSKEPLVMTVTDPQLDIATQAEVRAIGRMEQNWEGDLAFSYSVALRAADPRRYGADLRSASLAGSQVGTYRVYPRVHPWQYLMIDTTGAGVFLTNEGNIPAPVRLTYVGGLANSVLTDDDRSIRVDNVYAPTQLVVNSDSLAIRHAQGGNAARYLMAGSQPMTIPPDSTVRWRFFVGSGPAGGFLRLEWRSAWL